jgi:alpha-D-ribose 1-methylphosphonate 5-triphosphate diphosphatase
MNTLTSAFVLDNAHIVLEDTVIHGHVVVRDGHIAEIGAGRCRLPNAQDLEGDHLVPGLVELHTDNVERHLVPRPGVRWPTLPGILAHDSDIISAGITTVLDAVACGSDYGKEYRRDICNAAVAGIQEARDAGYLRADHLLHLRCEIAAEDMAETFEHCIGNDMVRLVSIMDHTPGARQFTNLDKFAEYYKGKHGMNDEQLAAMIDKRREIQARFGPTHREQVVSGCHERGITLASHDDATEEHIEEAVALGVTISEFPTTVAAAEAAHRHGLATIMGAPNMVRGKSHSGNIAAGELAKLGLLDVLSSDYVPISLMQAAWLLYENGAYSLPDAMKVVSGNPAHLLGLDDRGSIAPGKLADLVRVRRTGHGPVIRRVWREGKAVA